MAETFEIRRRGAEPVVLSATDAEAVCELVDEARFAEEVHWRLTGRFGGSYVFDDPLTSEVRFLIGEGCGSPDDIVGEAMAAWLDRDWETSREEALEQAFEACRRSMAPKRSEHVRREMAELGRF
ncbi:hypothetical protein [Caniella muris]|uniref:hypothetical protein n=1 Tax=Caniella muris TaxID=2941502 RepID=UPI0020406A25|nr:hypothetical protein [Caniella muris]